MPHASPLEASLAAALGDRLRHLREEAGLTQEQVAQAADISRQHYQLLEVGLGNRRKRSPSNPTLSTLAALSTVLGTTVPDLIDDLFAR